MRTSLYGRGKVGRNALSAAVLLLSAWLPSSRGTPVQAAAADEVVLENATTRLVLREGRIVSLFDKARSVEHLATEPAASRGLFVLEFVRGIEPAGELDSGRMATRVVRATEDSAEIRFEDARATATVRVRLSESPGETQWSIAVAPGDRALAISRVAFPIVATPRAGSDAEKSYLLPMFEGRFAPLRYPPLWRAYPTHLFAQMIACVEPKGGFVLWTDDGAGHVKEFGFENLRQDAAFAVRHLMPYAPGQAWESPYRTRLAFCDGSWQAAAGVYRAWASAQPWSSTRLRDRNDLSELLRRPPLCLSTQLDREDLETLPDRLAAWGDRFHTPIVYRPLGWEKHGNWVGIDYLPPSVGEARFRELTDRLRARGIVMAGFISGYRWTTRSASETPAGNLALAEFFGARDGALHCERTRAGELLSMAAEGRDSYRICRGTALGRGFLQQISSELFDLGVAAIHDDQDHGPYPNGVESCFDPDHGHPVPCGSWSTDVTRTALREIREEAVRRGLDDFLLTKESCSELMNMDLDAYQARYFHEATTPGLVPLSQYLYHEYIPTMFGWVTATSVSQWELAAMLVYGQIPSLAFWNDAASGPEALPAGSLSLLQDYFAAMQSHARPYLLFGRMRPPLVPDVPTRQAEAPRKNARAPGQTRVLTVPLVIQSAWEDERGNLAVFAVNTLPREVTLRVPAPAGGPWQALFYRGTTEVSKRMVSAGEELNWPLSPIRLESLIFEQHP